MSKIKDIDSSLSSSVQLSLLKGAREVLYEDFINDLPLKAVVNDLEHNEEMVTKYCYDSNKNITYKEDYLGNVEEYLYNERGQLLEKKI